MTAGRFALVCFSLTILGWSSAALRAQEPADPAIETARYQIEGLVNGNAVFIRSGASENDYATMQLNKGDPVTVVGERFNWLKIIPPDGSFCYVAKAYVNRAGDGSIGQSTGTPYVRVGSSLNQLKTKIGSKLEPGQRVEIVGEQDEYFKIKPPADVFYYINKQFVDPVRQLPQPGEQPPSQPPALPQNPELTQNDGAGPTTQPGPIAQQDGNVPEGAPEPPVAAGPATQPSMAQAEAEFERLEAQYSQASRRPLDEQPIAELLSGYEKLASSTVLPESLRRISEAKVDILKSRAKMQQDYADVRKAQEDMKTKLLVLEAERKELEQKIGAASVKLYAAIGTLRPSSLQFGQVTLYRLTDPANERTVVYLRSDDGKLGQRLGEFVGVNGQITVDSQRNMTIIIPTEVVNVEISKVGNGVVATHTPASLLPGIASGADTAP